MTEIGPEGYFVRDAFSGQDADFCVETHESAERGEEDAARNEGAVRQGRLVLSRRRTLRGIQLFVAAFSGRGETAVFVPPDGVIRRHLPLYDPKPEGDG